MEKIKIFYRKHKKKLIGFLVIFILFCLLLHFYLFFNEKLNEDDLQFESLEWSESCEGKNYTAKEKEGFCQKCLVAGGKECDWPLDMNISIEKVERTIKTGGEIHCYIIVDNVNYYTEKGSYYGITENLFFTWQLLDASKPHIVEFCCGIERANPLSNFLRLEKKWPQACIREEIKERCT